MKKILSFLLLAMVVLSLSVVSNAQTHIFAFEDAEYSVLVGKTIKLKPIAQGIDVKLTYEWYSQDETIATVQNGTVKGESGGTTQIVCSATTEEGTAYEANCTVIVNVPIQSITAEKQSVEIAQAPIGAGYPVSQQTEEYPPYMYIPEITISPSDASNQTLDWTSANPAIARVTTNGVIYGEYPGSTTVTGKATDGSGKTVKIKVTVLKCYVTEDNVTITSPDGAEIGYIRYSANGFNSYSTKTKGDIFYIDYLDDYNGMEMLRIVPVKAGSGSISFIHNGKVLKTVKVKIDHSAVYDNVSYPPVKIATLVETSDDSIGTKTQVTCEVVKIEPLPKLGANGGGLVYGMVEEDGNRYYVVFEYTKATTLVEGETYTIFGELSTFVDYVTETGLVYKSPYFIKGHINII